MKYGRAAVLIVVAVLATSPLSAHHYTASIFDLTSKQTLTGKLTKIDWRNPHVELTMDVTDGHGDVEVWKIEGMSPSWFRARNAVKADFDDAIGRVVVVEVMRAKDGSLNGLLQKITLSETKSVTVPEVRNEPQGNR
jgi:hypothetical protein